MQNVPVVEAHHLCIDYFLGNRWVNAIRDVSLIIQPLEIHGLVGESGSGKSTLALALMRYLAKNARISSGEIRLDGSDLLGRSEREMSDIWGQQLSLVPQDPLAALNPSYRVGDQIAEISQRHDGLPRRAAWKRAVEMLERVRIADPEAVARKYPHQLSGGMQQRVTIAMALSTRPRLLVLDEPTTALDVTTEASILDLFRDLIHENQAAALYVSHNLGVIAQMCDRVTVLYAGEVMASGPITELYGSPVHPYTISLLASIPQPVGGTETRLPTIDGLAPSLADRPSGCTFAPRCPVAQDLCHAEKPPLEVIHDGQWVKCHRWREIATGSLTPLTTPIEVQANSAAPEDDQYVLNGNGLDKRFGQSSWWSHLRRRSGSVQALDDVTVRVRRHSTLGLVGESGSGKTTLARCIVGLETADDGDITLLDLPISRVLAERPQDARRALQMVFQNPNDTLNPYHTIGQALSRTLRRLSAVTLSEEQIQSRVRELLDMVRLPTDYINRYPGELSGGEKQRAAIARAFATQPELVIADEPTSALDVSVQAVILNLLKDLRAAGNASYIFISHDLRAVGYLADWLMVLYLGQVVEEGTLDQVYSNPSHPYTEALISAIPVPDPQIKQGRIRLDGDIPSAANVPAGCRFHTRCPRKIGAICEQQEPPWQDASDGHRIRCHIPPDELAQLQSAASAQPLERK